MKVKWVKMNEFKVELISLCILLNNRISLRHPITRHGSESEQTWAKWRRYSIPWSWLWAWSFRSRIAHTIDDATANDEHEWSLCISAVNATGRTRRWTKFSLRWSINEQPKSTSAHTRDPIPKTRQVKTPHRLYGFTYLSAFCLTYRLHDRPIGV